MKLRSTLRYLQSEERGVSTVIRIKESLPVSFSPLLFFFRLVLFSSLPLRFCLWSPLRPIEVPSSFSSFPIITPCRDRSSPQIADRTAQTQHLAHREHTDTLSTIDNLFCQEGRDECICLYICTAPGFEAEMSSSVLP